MNELEKQRLAILAQYKIMDSPPEEEYDNIVKLVSQICKVPISLITLIDDKRQWFKANIGFGDFTETPREVAFCNHTIQQDDIMIIEDATKDERFKQNPLVSRENGIRFYAGVPLTSPQGFKLGSLCVIDEVPNQLNEQQIFALRTLGQQVMNQMELRKQNQELVRLVAEMHEQNQNLQTLNAFNRKLQSIVSHDLRNPIGATRHFLNFVASGELSAEDIATWTHSIGKNLELSEKLLNNLIELGISSFKNDDQQRELIKLKDFIQGIVEEGEIQFQIKQNKFVNEIEGIELRINPYLLEFVLRNLIQNANKFTQHGTITALAHTQENLVTIQIKDSGQGIDKETLGHLFDFTKNQTTLGTIGEQGSGLGLVICKEFTLRMNGEIWAESEPKKGSVFYVKLPIGIMNF